MTNYQKTKLVSYKLIITEAKTYELVTDTIPRFKGGINRLDEICIEAEGIQVQQEKDITGVAEDKHQTLDNLVTIMAFISGALQSYAKEKNDYSLFESVYYTESCMGKLRHTDINPTAELLIEETEKLAPEEIAEIGISADDITNLKSLLEEFKQIVQSPRLAIIERSGLTEKLRQLFNEASDLKKYVLDNLALQFKYKAPEFYLKYVAAGK